jgi:serine/threonine protein kinase
MGLVHRDIKPANVMLNRRGGVPDFVKLLDFGLVRAVDDAKRNKHQEGMAGTPLYMSPESIQTPDLVDARSDLYAVGAIGYFLLTGSPVFQATSLAELCQLHVDAIPLAPSLRAGKPISSELEHAIMSCLEKNRSKRPQTARDLANLIHRLAASDFWTINDADAWWSRYERGGNPMLESSKPTAIPPRGDQSNENQTHMHTQNDKTPAKHADSASSTIANPKDFDKTMDYGTIANTTSDPDDNKNT